LFPVDEDLALLSMAAKEAGRLALSFFGRDPKVWMKKRDKPPVSEADFAVDAYLKQILLQARPDYGWISEESVDGRREANYQRFFVVDPIDGTRGFINGSSQWCISVAIVEAGQPICGVLECPVRQEHYSAHLGAKTRLNDAPISLPDVLKNQHKIRISCSAAKTRIWPQNLQQRLEFAPSIPSLAYRLALVATGALDVVVVRPDSHDWDLAAADIILRQSGNNLATLQGTCVPYGKPPFTHHFLLAGHAYYKNQIAQYL